MSNWGPTDVDKHRWWQARDHDLHVYVGEEDVTSRCRFFDDTSTPPVAELYRLNAEGRKYLDSTGKPAIEVIHDFEIRTGAR